MKRIKIILTIVAALIIGGGGYFIAATPLAIWSLLCAVVGFFLHILGKLKPIDKI
ncbi:hypothetical protein GR160_02960 [Flavobacterium sp. Sd200]|uniref:hypothetical protein n=1 Tax=Flavobacterium sp. Sd200 TaxID=2692211 RepID=UPI001371F7A1|nr:hypothetical protein [Flavobacterium sp. Sd200]MXN90174.1 hypothetical protein [Flavobacterium sp. Sd200]